MTELKQGLWSALAVEASGSLGMFRSEGVAVPGGVTGPGRRGAAAPKAPKGAFTGASQVLPGFAAAVLQGEAKAGVDWIERQAPG